MLFREKEAEKQEMNPFENYGLQDVTQMSWNQPMDYSYGAFTNEGEWDDGTMGTMGTMGAMGMGIPATDMFGNVIGQMPSSAPTWSPGQKDDDDELMEEQFLTEQTDKLEIGQRVSFTDDNDEKGVGVIQNIDDDVVMIRLDDGSVELIDTEDNKSIKVIVNPQISPEFRPGSPEYSPTGPPQEFRPTSPEFSPFGPPPQLSLIHI